MCPSSTQQPPNIKSSRQAISFARKCATIMQEYADDDNRVSFVYLVGHVGLPSGNEGFIENVSSKIANPLPHTLYVCELPPKDEDCAKVFSVYVHVHPHHPPDAVAAAAAVREDVIVAALPGNVVASCSSGLN
jgi:hypothetical protein